MKKSILFILFLAVLSSFVFADWVRTSSITSGSITNNIYICNATQCDFNWTSIINTPTTLAGYGITDAYTKTEIDTQQLDQNNTINLKLNINDQRYNETSLINTSLYYLDNNPRQYINILDVKYNQIQNPNASTSLNFANFNNVWDFNQGTFEINQIGAFVNDLVHIHQHTGNPTSGSDLLHLEAEDSDVIILNVTGNRDIVAYFNNNVSVEGSKVCTASNGLCGQNNSGWIYNGTTIVTNDSPRVGINAQSPLAQLEVIGTDSTLASTQRGILNIGSSNSINTGIGGTLTFTGIVDGGGTYRVLTAIESYKENAVSGNQNSSMIFYNNINGVLTETMRIATNGIGVGTSSPTGALDLRSSKNFASSTGFPLVLVDTTSQATGVGGGIRFMGAYSGTTVTSSGAYDTYKRNATSGDYCFDTRLMVRPMGGQLSEAMRLNCEKSITMFSSLDVNSSVTADNYNLRSGFNISSANEDDKIKFDNNLILGNSTDSFCNITQNGDLNCLKTTTTEFINYGAKKHIDCKNDFLVTDTNKGCWFGSGISGGVGTVTSGSGDKNHPGTNIIRSLANGINSGYYFYTLTTAIEIEGTEYFMGILTFPNIITGTNTTVSRIGYWDSITSTEPVDCIMFRIIGNNTGWDFYGVTRSNNAETNTSTIFSTFSNTDFYNVFLRVNSDASRVDFYIYNSTNGVTDLLWNDSITTNIPKGSSRVLGGGAMGYLQGNTSSAIINILEMDYLEMDKEKILIR